MKKARNDAWRTDHIQEERAGLSYSTSNFVRIYQIVFTFQRNLK